MIAMQRLAAESGRRRREGQARSTRRGSARGSSVGSQASRPNAYRLAWASGCPVQNGSSPTLDTAQTPERRRAAPRGHAERRCRRLRSPRREGEHLAPLRRQVAHVPLLAGVLLGHLELHRQPGGRHRRDHRGDRLACLEVDRAVLHLQDHVVRETARRAGRSGRTRRGPGRSSGRASPAGGCRRSPPVHHAAVAAPARRRAGSRRRRGRARTPNGPGWPSESAFTTYPPKSGIALVHPLGHARPPGPHRLVAAGRRSAARRGRPARRR